MSKINNNNNNNKSSQGNQGNEDEFPTKEITLYYREIFSSETLQAMREWNQLLKLLYERTYEPRVLYTT